jgi:hypothetical protein
MLKVADLTPEQIEKIKQVRYDYFYEKHEGPWKYESEFRYGDGPIFMELGGYDVLMPIEERQVPNIKPQRILPSTDGRVLTIFYTDSTYYPDEPFTHGMLTICERMPGETWYIATFIHSRYDCHNSVLES